MSTADHRASMGTINQPVGSTASDTTNKPPQLPDTSTSDDDAIERAARAIYDYDLDGAGTAWSERMPWDQYAGLYREQARAALAAAGLLASPAREPGRSDAETEWGVMSDRYGYVIYTDLSSREEAETYMKSDLMYVVRREVGPWVSADQVTDTKGSE